MLSCTARRALQAAQIFISDITGRQLISTTPALKKDPGLRNQLNITVDDNLYEVTHLDVRRREGDLLQHLKAELILASQPYPTPKQTTTPKTLAAHM